MHTHFSFISALNSFMAIVVIGTLWRLISAHLMAAKHPTAKFVGQAMAFQY
ncbi:hypothetical protein ACFWY9_30575 [Amycolatopsis sp. NPDC059027]|uniref:hypothetical protein n=1 Tax=Amycolatopsis sp. NPDC059027 TaxID=3346709 RepID=UPI00366BA54E